MPLDQIFGGAVWQNIFFGHSNAVLIHWSCLPVAPVAQRCGPLNFFSYSHCGYLNLI